MTPADYCFILPSRSTMTTKHNFIPVYVWSPDWKMLQNFECRMEHSSTESPWCELCHSMPSINPKSYQIVCEQCLSLSVSYMYNACWWLAEPFRWRQFTNDFHTFVLKISYYCRLSFKRFHWEMHTSPKIEIEWFSHNEFKKVLNSHIWYCWSFGSYCILNDSID